VKGTTDKKPGAGDPPPDWRQGPSDPVERWIETRGYWRQRARNDDGQDQDTCKRQFEFADGKLAECRIGMQTTEAQFAAISEISAAIGRRGLSSLGERKKGKSPALGLLRDPEIAKRLDPEIREAILALFGGFAGLLKAVFAADYGGANAILQDAGKHADAIEAALIELSGVAAATKVERKQQISRRKGGAASAAARKKPAAATKAAVEVIAAEHPDWSLERIGRKAGCSKSTVSRALAEGRRR
jgi:hypothetical protein